MKNALVFILVVTLTALPAQINLTGTISSEYFNKPLDSCSIRLNPASPTAKADSSFSNSTGMFSISNVWPGVYIAIASRPGYLVDSQTVIIDSSRAINFSLRNISNSWSANLPDTLKKTSSPFFITDTLMNIGHSLFIENGVYISFKGSLYLNGPEVKATGKSTDAIMFKGISPTCQLFIASPKQTFSACSFSNILNFSFCHSRFDSCSFDSIGNFANTANDFLIIKNSRLTRTGIMMQNIDTITFVGNIVYFPEVSYSLNLGTSQNGMIKNNTFLCPLFISSYNSTDTIINNIMMSMELQKFGTKNLFFGYNDIARGSVTLPGVGSPVIRNDNGDSCDLFFNIFSDPKIADINTCALQNNSPCIKAGINGSNIGVWQQIQTISRERIRDRRPLLSNAQKYFSVNRNSRFKHTQIGINCNMTLYSLNGRRVIASIMSQKTITPGIYVTK